MLSSGEDSVVAALDEVRRLRKQAGPARPTRPQVHVATYGFRDSGPGGDLRNELRAPTPMDVVRGPFHAFSAGQQVWPPAPAPELPSPRLAQRTGGRGWLVFLLLVTSSAAVATGYGYVTTQKQAERATAQHGAALARLEAKLGEAVEARARAERQAIEGSARVAERMAACEAELARRPVVAPAPAEPSAAPKPAHRERPAAHRRSHGPAAAAKAKPSAPTAAPAAKVPPRIAPKRMVSDDPLAGLRGAR